MKWLDDPAETWDEADDDPPTVESDHSVTMENRPGGVDGLELREIQTGAWLASTATRPLSDALDA